MYYIFLVDVAKYNSTTFCTRIMKAPPIDSPIGGAVMWVSTAKVWWQKVVVGGLQYIHCNTKHFVKSYHDLDVMRSL